VLSAVCYHAFRPIFVNILSNRKHKSDLWQSASAFVLHCLPIATSCSLVYMSEKILISYLNHNHISFKNLVHLRIVHILPSKILCELQQIFPKERGHLHISVVFHFVSHLTQKERGNVVFYNLVGVVLLFGYIPTFGHFPIPREPILS
jgi:hypothetical protein